MKPKNCISAGFLFCSMVFILMVLSADLAIAATSYCNNCNDCENKITSASPGDTVKLSSDIINQSGRCINWKKSNVKFDCQGYVIGGSGKKEGIYIESKFNNTIKNCAIVNFDVGIDVWNSSNTITSNTINSNGWIGILFRYAYGNVISNNSVISNKEDGIYLLDSYGNTITGNNISSNNRYGLYFGESPSNAITGNDIISNKYGLYLTGASGNTITGNAVTLNKYGLYLWHSSKNVVNNNVIRSNERGIVLWNYSDSNVMNSNQVCSNTDLDFYLNTSSGNQGSGNTCNNTRGWSDQGAANCAYSCTEADNPSPFLISDLQIAAIILILIVIISMVLYRKKSMAHPAKKPGISKLPEKKEVKKTDTDKMRIMDEIRRGRLELAKKDGAKKTGTGETRMPKIQGEKIVPGNTEEEMGEIDVNKIQIMDEIEKERTELEKKKEELRIKKEELEKKKSMLKI